MELRARVRKFTTLEFTDCLLGAQRRGAPYSLTRRAISRGSLLSQPTMSLCGQRKDSGRDLFGVHQVDLSGGS
jgi:hypothetical protein